MESRTGAVRLLNFRSLTQLLKPLLLLASSNLLWVCGCESTDVPAANEQPPEGANIVLTQDNNFTAIADFAIPSVDTPVADLTFTWNNATSNVLCETIDPATGIGGVWLVRVKGKNQDAVTESIESFSLSTDVDVTVGIETAGRTTTQAQMTEMKATNGDPLMDIGQFYIPSSAETLYTYMLLLTEGDQIDRDAVSMKFLNPVGSGELTVAGEPGCDPNAAPPLLTYTPTLGAPVPVAATGPWIVDWFAVKLDSQGKSVSFGKLDRVLLAFHEGMEAEDFRAQEQFFKLESAATLVYELKLTGGTGADLSQASLIQNLPDPNTLGAPFTGFSTPNPGVWMMAVMCEECSNPSPVILSVLQPPG